MVENLVPDPLIKNQIWAYLWISSPKFYKVCFYCKSKSRSTKTYKTNVLITCFDLIWSFFQKTKRGIESLSISLSALFLKKNLSHIIFYWLTEFHCLIVFTSWDTGFTVIICCPVCDVINFETNLSLLIKPFFYISKNQDKNFKIWRTKRAFNVKKEMRHILVIILKF